MIDTWFAGEVTMIRILNEHLVDLCPRINPRLTVQSLTVHELLLRSDCYRPNDMATMKDLAMAVRLTVDNRCIQMKRKPLDAEGGCQPVINLWI
jgi:hypothetical protein